MAWESVEDFDTLLLQMGQRPGDERVNVTFTPLVLRPCMREFQDRIQALGDQYGSDELMTSVMPGAPIPDLKLRDRLFYRPVSVLITGKISAVYKFLSSLKSFVEVGR